IEGPGAGTITVSGNQAARVFDIFPGANVTLAGLTIANGKVEVSAINNDVFAFAGGIYNAGSLTLSQCTVSGNVGQADLTNNSGNGHVTYSYGGGLYTSGTATVVDCTFRGNVASYSFSSSGSDSITEYLGHGGGIANTGQLLIMDSTLDGNTGVGNG